MSKEKLLISFSGGRTSAYMAWWLLKNMQHKYEMVVVFANTGKEREETLQFVHKCDVEFDFNTVWVEAVVRVGKIINNRKHIFTIRKWNRIKNKLYKQGYTDSYFKQIVNFDAGTINKKVDFKTSDRRGTPFEDVISKYGIPNQNAPHCTRELKQQTIKSYARSIGWKDYQTALGIRSDEPKRLDWVKKHKSNLLYFAELFAVTKSNVNLFWSKQVFDLDLKSYEGNCDLCYKKGIRKLMTIVKDKPEFADWWRKMEQKYGMFIPDGRLEKIEERKALITDNSDGDLIEVSLPIYFFRDKMSIDEVIEESNLPFTTAVDTSKDIDDYRQMAIWDDYLDSNNGCTESCEVY